jgi:hypothetical protein
MSYWKYCFTGPDGEEICTEIYAELRPGDGVPLNWRDALTMTQIDVLAGQIADETLRAQVVQTVDSVMGELSNRMPAGTALRRAG